MTIFCYNSLYLYLDPVEENTEQLLTMNYMRSCPNPKHSFPESVRKPLKDLVSGVCPRTLSTKHISAMEFRVSFITFISKYIQQV